MGLHTFPLERAEALDDPARYRYCSAEELIEMLALDPTDLVLDLGSGTGFYAADVAPFVERLVGVDIQAEMHRLHRANGPADTVDLVTADVDDLPFLDATFDAAFSVVTHHEYASDDAMAGIVRVLRPGGRLVTVDWSAEGTGEEGPPLDERFFPAEIGTHLEDAGLHIVETRDRPETVAIVAAR